MTTFGAAHQDQERKALVVGGKYCLERILGVGGMGTVFEATHVALGARVALKRMKPGLAVLPEYRERFLREARALFRMRSPRIVRMFDVEVDRDGGLWLAMELLEGETLAARLDAWPPLPADQVIAIAHGVAEGLAEAHRNGVIHRDVKPENVMLTEGPDGQLTPKLLDFGVAHGAFTSHDTRLTAMESRIGTFPYMAPELLRDGSVADPRTDVWALGVMLFEMLTGERPWAAKSPSDLAVRQHTEPLDRTRLQSVAAPLRSIVERCLALHPADRFADGRAVADALSRLAASRAASQTRAPQDRFARFLSVAVAAVLALSFTTFAVSSARSGRTAKAPTVTPAAEAVLVPIPVDSLPTAEPERGAH